MVGCSKEELGVIAAKVEANADLVSKELNWRDEAFKEYRRSQVKALELAANNLNHRLIELNALRRQVTEDRSSFLRTDVYESRHIDLQRQMDRVQAFQNKMIGVAAVVVLIVGILGAFIGHLLST